MSMKVSGNYSDSRTSYAEQLKAEQFFDQAEKAGKTNKAQKDPETADKIPVPRDEYTGSESSGEKLAVCNSLKWRKQKKTPGCDGKLPDMIVAEKKKFC